MPLESSPMSSRSRWLIAGVSLIAVAAAGAGVMRWYQRPYPPRMIHVNGAQIQARKGERHQIVAPHPTTPKNFALWQSSHPGIVADPKNPETTVTMPDADVTVTPTYWTPNVPEASPPSVPNGSKK